MKTDSREEETQIVGSNAIREDFVNYGFIREFLGRIAQIVFLDPLTSDDLKIIMTTKKNNVIEQFKLVFKINGIDLEFADDAIETIAQKAIKNKMGARGLYSIVNDILMEVMFENFGIPEKKGEKITIDALFIESRKSISQVG